MNTACEPSAEMQQRKVIVEKFYIKNNHQNSTFDAIIQTNLDDIKALAKKGSLGKSNDDDNVINVDEDADEFIDEEAEKAEAMQKLLAALDVLEVNSDEGHSSTEEEKEEDPSSSDSDDIEEEKVVKVTAKQSIGFNSNYKVDYCSNPILRPESSFELRRFIVRLQMKMIEVMKGNSTSKSGDIVSVDDPIHYQTAAFLHTILNANTMSPGRRNELNHVYTYLSTMIEYFSNGQLTIQPFGSIAMGLGTNISDIDVSLVLNPSYSRTNKVDVKTHFQQSKKIHQYEGPLPSVWADTLEMPKEFYNLPIIQTLNPFAAKHLMKKIHAYSGLLNMKGATVVTGNVQLLTFTTDVIEPVVDVLEAHEKEMYAMNNQKNKDNKNHNNFKSQFEFNRDQYRNSWKLSAPIEIDVVSSDDQSMAKTEFIRSMMALCPYTYPLVLLIKHWSSQRAILGAANGYLNSFSYLTMVIFFLQVCGELPVLHKNSSPNPHIKKNGPILSEPWVKVDQDATETDKLVPNIDVVTGSSFVHSASVLARPTDISPLLSPLHQLPPAVQPAKNGGNPFIIMMDQINNLDALNKVHVHTTNNKSNRHGGEDTKRPHALSSRDIVSFTAKNRHKLLSHEWRSPMTGEIRATLVGTGNIPEYTRYMTTDERKRKDGTGSQYRLEGNTSPDSPDLPHRFAMHHPSAVLDTLPPHCIQHRITQHYQLKPLRALTFLNDGVVKSMSPEEKKKYQIPLGMSDVKSTFAERLVFPVHKIPHLGPAYKPGHVVQAAPTTTQFLWSRLVQLLGDFFYFYGFVFNPDLHAISIRNGHLTWVHEVVYLYNEFNFSTNTALYIEDPFEPLNNSARSINLSARQVIISEFQRAAILMAANGKNSSISEPIVPIMNVFTPLSAEVLSLYHNYLQITEGHQLTASTRNKTSQVKNLSNLHKLKIGDLAHQCCFNSNLLTEAIQRSAPLMSYLTELYGKMQIVKAGGTKNHGQNLTTSTVSPDGLVQSLLPFNKANVGTFQSILWNELLHIFEP